MTTKTCRNRNGKTGRFQKTKTKTSERVCFRVAGAAAPRKARSKARSKVSSQGVPLHATGEKDWKGQPTYFVKAADLPKGPYTLMLSSVPNVDLMYGQGTGTGYWQGGIQAAPKTVKVASIAAASKRARAYIQSHGLGGGNWTGGEIKKGNKTIARVSYNGRVWHPGKSFGGDAYEVKW